MMIRVEIAGRSPRLWRHEELIANLFRRRLFPETPDTPTGRCTVERLSPRGAVVTRLECLDWSELRARLPELLG